MKITLFYKNATVLDYAYLDDHLGVVGNSLKVNVEFIGQTDDEGVVYDFSYAKKKVKEVIDRDCDHRLVVPKHLVQSLDNDLTKLEYIYGHGDEKMTYECPSEGLCAIPFAHVSNENLTAYLEEQVLKEMPDTVTAIRLELEEETLPENKARFHYTHGLKEHYGNCQRLFHGHQNTVDVYINNKRDESWEQKISRELFKGNVHFALWENIINKDDVIKASGQKLPEGRFNELPQIEIEYEASQGKFKGSLPGRAVYIVQEESTVENLSIHFAKLVKASVSEGDIVRVHAYEGIAKGSITTL